MNAWEEWKIKNAEKQKQGKVTPTAFLNPNTEYAEESVAKQRFDTCSDCEELIPVTHQCKQCGCFMSQKTKLLYARCPLEKW